VDTVSSDALAVRVSMLSQVDAARLLESVVLEIGERITFGDLVVAERRLQAWEDALGKSLAAVATSVADMRGGRGYGVSSAAFARQQQWRKDSLHALRFAITSGSRRDFDRWKWAAAAYLDDIASFAAMLRERHENAKLAKQLTTRLPSGELRRYRVLSTCVAERRLAVNASHGAIPAVAAHNLARMAAIADDVERYALDRAARLTERAEAERAALERVGALVKAATARARSIDGQIAIYRQIVAEAERADRLQRAALQSDTLSASLGAYANGDVNDQTPLLSRLAGKLMNECEPEQRSGR
jgi:hypothetical protein